MKPEYAKNKDSQPFSQQATYGDKTAIRTWRANPSLLDAGGGYHSSQICLSCWAHHEVLSL
jgi:hypothetical protein